MPKRELKTSKEKSEIKKLNKEQLVDEAKTKIINKIIDELTLLIEEIDNKEAQDSTDGIGNKIKNIFQPILEKFEELIAENEDKKPFIGRFIKIFTILLTVRCTSANKLKKKISAEIAQIFRGWSQEKWSSNRKNELQAEKLLLLVKKKVEILIKNYYMCKIFIFYFYRYEESILHWTNKKKLYDQETQ